MKDIQESKGKKADEAKEDEGCVCSFLTNFNLLVQLLYFFIALLSMLRFVVDPIFQSTEVDRGKKKLHEVCKLNIFVVLK